MVYTASAISLDAKSEARGIPKMSNVTSEVKKKGNEAVTTGEKWADDSSDREIVSFKRLKEEKLSDQWIEGWGLCEETLKQETEDMGAWNVLVFQLTAPMKNVSEDGKIYDIPVGTQVCVSKVFKIAHLAELMKDPEKVYKIRIKMNGEKKLGGPRNPMQLFKIQISDKVGRRADIAPTTVHKLASQAAAAALPSATPFD
jgi:hypothetical protein